MSLMQTSFAQPGCLGTPKDRPMMKGSRKKKVLHFMAGPLRGGGIKAGLLRKKEFLLNFYFVAKFQRQLSSGGG